MFELTLHLDKEVKTCDDVKLTINGEPVCIKKIIVPQELKDEFDEELKEAYLAIENDRKELNVDWDRITGEGWE